MTYNKLIAIFILYDKVLYFGQNKWMVLKNMREVVCSGADP